MSRARRYVAQNKRRGKILHLSAVIVHIKDEATGLRHSYVRRPGMTYRRKTPNVRQTRQVRKARKAAKRAAKAGA